MPASVWRDREINSNQTFHLRAIRCIYIYIIIYNTYAAFDMYGAGRVVYHEIRLNRAHTPSVYIISQHRTISETVTLQVSSPCSVDVRYYHRYNSARQYTDDGSVSTRTFRSTINSITLINCFNHLVFTSAQGVSRTAVQNRAHTRLYIRGCVRVIKLILLYP